MAWRWKASFFPWTSGETVDANVTKVLGTAPNESAAGRLAAALTKFGDVATPVLTAESVNQSGDSHAVVTNATYGNSAIRTRGDVAWVTATGFAVPGSAMTLTAAYDAAKTAASAGAAMALTSGERTTLAAAIEAAIINELDGTAVMQASADLIASDMTTTDLTVAAIASAVRDAILNRVLSGNHDTAGTTGKLIQDGATAANLATANAVLAKLDTGLVADGVVYQWTANALELGPSGGLTVGQAASLAAIEEDTGTTLPAKIAALDVGSGTGPYSCTWTVTDGTSNLQNAIVSFWLNGVLKGHGTTNSDGEVSMSLGSETGTVTYDVAISCEGYVFTGTTHAVSSTIGTWTKTFAMTALVSTPSVEPDSVTVRWRVKKGNRQWAGAGEATVYIQIVDGPGTDGIIWHGDNEDFDSDTTDADGYVEFTEVPVPCTLGVRTGTGRQLRMVEIPSTATGVYDAGELISHDA